MKDPRGHGAIPARCVTRVHNVKIKMTLTAPGCGMGPVLAGDVKHKVEAVPGVKTAEVEVVFDPVWDRTMMSEAAKLQLGMMW
jgi:metal-sulfur cluster biosynthetic enzyme